MHRCRLKLFRLPAQLRMTVAQSVPDAEFPVVADRHTDTQTHSNFFSSMGSDIIPDSTDRYQKKDRHYSSRALSPWA